MLPTYVDSSQPQNIRPVAVISDKLNTNNNLDDETSTAAESENGEVLEQRLKITGIMFWLVYQ